MKNSNVRTDRKMAVLFCFVQTENQANGGVISLLNIARSLNNYTPIFLTQVRTSRTDELAECGYCVLYGDRFEWTTSWLKPLSILLWNIYVARIILSYRISVVHANDNQMVWRSIFAARLMRRKFVASIRGVFEQGKRYGWSRIWVNFCDYIVVLSNEMKTEMLQRLPFFSHWRAGKRIIVIGSVINDSLFLASRNDRCSSNINNVFSGNVLVVAAFNSLKNQLTFLNAAGQWFKEHNICLHFVGDYNPDRDNYSKACAAAVAELNIASHTVFHGFQRDPACSYLAADLTLVISKREGLARCMIESLACGTPVVSFDVCSAREMLEARTCGIVVKQGDYTSLCRQVLSLLENPILLNSMSVNARNASRDLFKKDEIIRRYEEIYE